MLNYLSFFVQINGSATDTRQGKAECAAGDSLQVVIYFLLCLSIQEVLVRGATQWLSDVLKVRPLTKNVTFER